MLKSYYNYLGPGSYFVSTTNLRDAASLFKFAADNTDVEWKLDAYSTDSGNKYLLITDHHEGDVENGHFAAKATKTIGVKIVDIHSHPSQESEGASVEDRTALKGNHNAVYLKKDATLHEYDAQRSNINSISINSSDDLELYIKNKFK